MAGCGGGDSSPVAPSNTSPAPPPAPVYPQMVGTWLGTVTITALGISFTCNVSLLVGSQTGGTFNGTFQESGGVGCSSAGNSTGTVTTGNQVSLTNVATVTDGAVCTDTNKTENGLVSGRTLTIQANFTRTCTSPAEAPFAESQTLNLTKQ